MNAWRALAAFTLANLRIWWRRPIEAVISIMLAVLFLIIANQAFTVWLGRQVRVGIHARDPALRQVLLLEMDRMGLHTTVYASEAEGQTRVRQGQLTVFVSAGGYDPLTVRLVLAGRNPLLDRELYGGLTRAAHRIFRQESPPVRMEVFNDRYSAEALTAFITAGMLAFFVFTLTHNNVGSFWVRDWEWGTVNTLLATPVSRLALLGGRGLAGCLLTLASLAAGMLVCRHIVAWPWPPRLGPWLGVVLLQVFAGNGFFFALASLCRSYRFYVNISSFLTIVMIFVSGTVTPVEIMPAWQNLMAHLTPTFPAVRTMRAVMLGTEPLLGADVWALALWGLGAHAMGYFRLATTTIKS